MRKILNTIKLSVAVMLLLIKVRWSEQGRRRARAIDYTRYKK